jgi:hypothetical protein
LQISKDRKKRVIDLYCNQHKSYAEIAQIERISPRDIHTIIKEEEARRQKHKQQEISAQAYQLFSEGKTPIEVAIILNLPASKVSKLYREYWHLKGLHHLNTIYKETNGKVWRFWKLYKELIKKKKKNIEQVANVIEIAINKLPYMESLYEQVKEQVEKTQRTIQRLSNDIAAKEYKISLLDRIAFASEQDCKRTEQRMQELISQKNRLEKLIANILDDGEGHSKLKQIVKAILSENKKLISISFTTLILTLKADPEMVKLIQNMPSANDGEQHKDDNNNIIKYLESNRDSILGLAEKNYENLVEALTNNAIDNAGASSSFSSTLSLPSSSTFSRPSTQTDSHRIEEAESFHNTKGDIAD